MIKEPIDIAFIVEGTPVPQGRPRFTRQGHAYDPQKSREYKKRVAIEAKKAMGNTPPFDGGITLNVRFCFEPPKSFTGGKRLAALSGALPKTTKPDTDNLVKGVMDALKGICWNDDSQVTYITAEKRYSETAAVNIRIFRERDVDLDAWKQLYKNQTENQRRKCL